MSHDIVQAAILGASIFLARIADVTLGTMRIVFISRGQKLLAPLLGFFELLVWLFALRLVIANLSNIGYYILFAAGYAAGTYVGLLVEERLAIGTRMIRVVTRKDASELVAALRRAGHGVTSLDAEGGRGEVNVLFSVVKRKDLTQYITLVKKYNPRAFYTIEDVKMVSAGVFAAHETFIGRGAHALARALTKTG